MVMGYLKISLRFVILLTCTYVNVLLFAQTAELNPNLSERPTKALLGDICGGGSWFSGNFEKAFLSRKRFFFTFRFGLGYFREYGEPYTTISTTTDQFLDFEYTTSSTETIIPKYDHLSLPLHLSFNLGGRTAYFETGWHFTYIPKATLDKINFTQGPLIGFRVYPEHLEGFVFRLYSNMPIEGFNRYKWYLPFGVSFGYSAE